eukprot:gnl/MRDRNA2_/MRDRNA2_112344_c0_seq1.p1 gnl/MRDRNA2_/MRDRNA2_112344_c0~~gnl/MRDRNA2_/MRDRNA2_112344_c0_seq1.p1  ORF type:complete len:493 (+),score=125.21 gnl/MRDRNA2_/MRDRNA2_112344_c0_seq1:67-1545(+)
MSSEENSPTRFTPSNKAVVDGCPAFGEGCPFTPQAVQGLLETGALEGLNQQCPAFEKGCPWQDTSSLQDVSTKLSEMPPSHRIDNNTTTETKASKSVSEMLQLIHAASVKHQEELGKCNVFSTEQGCPFKNVTSDGLPLVNQLEEMARETWGLESLENKQADKPTDVGACPDGLSRLLKKGTARSHRAAENVHFVRDFMQHKVSMESYRDLLAALFHVYAALEEELEQCAEKDSRVKAVYFPALARKATLLEDMKHFYGDDRASLATALYSPSPAAKLYAARLRDIGKSQPLLLVAHSYTRYLGDLSGGQLLAKAATKGFNLVGKEGISFFEFKDIPNAKSFKHEYRAILDGLNISQTEADQLVQEANLAFVHNMRLFEERDVAAGYITMVQSVEDAMAMVQEAKSALSFQKRYAALGEDEPPASAQCPFLPKKQSAANQQLQQGNAECPMMTYFGWLLPVLRPEKKPMKMALLVSIFLGTVALLRRRNRLS